MNKKYDSNDVIALIVKLIGSLVVIAGLAYAGYKLFTYLKTHFIIDDFCCDDEDDLDLCDGCACDECTECEETKEESAPESAE